MYLDKNVSVKSIIIFCYSLLFASRINVLISSSTPSQLWIVLEIIYLAIISFFCFLYPKPVLKINKKLNSQILVQIILILHTVLFGVVFINAQFSNLIYDYFQSQILFFLIVILTVAVACKYRLLYPILKASFYVLSFFLLFKLIANISDLNLSNISNIFVSGLRTRANFGFGHYNVLGNACSCNIMIWILLKNKKQSMMSKWIQNAFAAISAIMLLCSASRTALTGLVLYVLVFYFLELDRILKNKRFKGFCRALIVICIVSIVLMVFADIGFESFLVESNRITLVKAAIPALLNSNRVLFGLGYAANITYGTNLTPYTTYWLDNGYIYYLVTTGVIGLSLIVLIILMIWKGLTRHADLKIGKQVVAIFFVYLYSALFEGLLFQSGSVTNYIYMILFFVCMGNASEIRTWKEDN